MYSKRGDLKLSPHSGTSSEQLLGARHISGATLPVRGSLPASISSRPSPWGGQRDAPQLCTGFGAPGAEQGTQEHWQVGRVWTTVTTGPGATLVNLTGLGRAHLCWNEASVETPKEAEMRARSSCSDSPRATFQEDTGSSRPVPARGTHLSSHQATLSCKARATAHSRTILIPRPVSPTSHLAAPSSQHRQRPSPEPRFPQQLVAEAEPTQAALGTGVRTEPP